MFRDNPNVVFNLLNHFTEKDSDIQSKQTVLLNIQNVIKSLDDEKRITLFTDRMDDIFSNLLPIVLNSEYALIKTTLDVIETMLPDLEKINYSSNPGWIRFLEKLNKVECFSDNMRKMIVDNEIVWANYWKILVRLIGKQLHKKGNLINAFLFVLENAFKSSNENRIEAFKCWEELIKNFAKDPERMLSSSRIKLLCIPLNVNNMKTAELALIKFDTWWFLIRTIHSKAPAHWKIIMIPFLKFCYGEMNAIASPSSLASPGLLFPDVQKQAARALVEMMGHSDKCGGKCVGNFEKLSKPIVTVDIFNNIIANLLFCVKQAVPMITANSDNSDEDMQIATCLWTSCVKFITKITKVNESGVGVEILLSMLKTWKDKCDEDLRLSSLMLTDLIRQVFVTKILESSVILDSVFSEQNIITKPFQAIVYIICSSVFDKECLLEKRKSLFNYFIRSGLRSPTSVTFSEKLIGALKNEKNHCLLMKELMENLGINYKVLLDTVNDALLWPFKIEVNYNNALLLSPSWIEVYSSTRMLESNEDPVLEWISKQSKEKSSQPSVILVFLCAILKQGLKDNSGGSLKGLKTPLEILLSLLNHINIMTDMSVKSTLNVYNTVGSIITIVNTGRRIEQVYLLLLQQIAKQVLTVFSCVFRKVTDLKSHETEISKFLSYLQMYLLPIFCQHTSHYIVDILSLFLMTFDNSIKSKSIQILKPLQSNENLSKVDITAIRKILHDKNSTFASPTAAKKKTPLDQADTEEFVVIKPTWKFDPHKLTDHQAEMMKRRREDIPALYEDLSQSQDNSNIKAWKPPGYKSDSSLGENTNPVQSSESQVPDSIEKPIDDKVTVEEEPKSTVTTPTGTPKRDKLKLSIRSKITNSLKKLNVISDDKIPEEESIVPISKESAQPEDTPQPEVPIVSTLEAERPSRLKRKPVKFSPDQVSSLKKQNSQPSSPCTSSQESNESITNTPIVLSSPKSLTKKKSTMASPNTTKLIRRKSRIERQLSIDTVEGHPNKELIKTVTDENTRITRKRKLKTDSECSQSKLLKKNNESQDIEADLTMEVDDSESLKLLKKSESRDNRDYNELKEVEMYLEPLQPSVSSTLANSQESEDIIASSQDSSVSSCSIKTPRRQVSITLEKQAEVTEVVPPAKSEEGELSPRVVEEADTQPMEDIPTIVVTQPDEPVNINELTPTKKIKLETSLNTSIVSSPHHDNILEKTLELLNNTIDISPIKPSAPISNDEDPVPLAAPSPDKADNSVADEPPAPPVDTSPELFCTEKLSPPKSPPKIIKSLAPVFAFNKNSRPSISRGRGAHMIGLCMLESDTIKCNGVDDVEMAPKIPKEDVKSSDANPGSPVRRNLQVAAFNAEPVCDVRSENEPVLEFNKLLPSPYASPAAPILKKLDDNSFSSPSTKRKRVSFHDPPVSTTMSIQKYIEPEFNIRSPQQVTCKNFRNRINKPLAAKSLIKKMDSEANLESAMLENDSIVIDSPQLMEVTKNSTLNDNRPVYPQLCNSVVPIKEVASELSSPMLKDLFLKDVDVKTIGDLASMTELEINRLPIRSPKLVTVKKVLSAYEKSNQMQIERSETPPIEEIIEKVVTVMKDAITECEQKVFTECANQTDDEVRKTFTECLSLYRNNSTTDEIQTDMKEINKCDESLGVLKTFASSCPSEYVNIATSQLSSHQILDQIPIADILNYIKIKVDEDQHTRSTARIALSTIETEITNEIKEKVSEKINQLNSIQTQLSGFVKSFEDKSFLG